MNKRGRELRIGNILNWMGRICLVIEIDENDFVVADIYQEKLDSNYHYSSDEVITHWELTEEWLIKLGAEKINCGSGKYFLSLGAGITFNIHQLGKIMLSCNGHDFCGCDSGEDISEKIKYVHQLQNLYFALTGVELELKELC